MVKYSANVELPEYILSFFNSINSYASIASIDVNKGSVVIWIEQNTDDEYELALVVRDLQDELESSYFDTVNISRPKKVS